ncbi:RNA polymerase sigma factor [Aporhodopirellula aestuarii]|uniref:RNA polymerase sigma-70 region 2 domain-containing protein n=1 Tax=Aporhodopirellula aestuarii TaxID=2950107 RepID=A0ABT0UBQ6_9BACT|nr:hypothetical protein [Aporhodopirellula aestuarii]MCM2374428.1 hypothetical protein [Aporhodopirellula aestuarii]
MCRNDLSSAGQPIDDANCIANAAAKCKRAYDEMLEHCADGDPTEEDLTQRLPSLKADFERSLERLIPIVDDAASRIAKRFSPVLDETEFQQVARIHISRKISQFRSGTFVGWLNTVLARLAISGYRKKRKTTAREVTLDKSSELAIDAAGDSVQEISEERLSSSFDVPYKPMQEAFEKYWSEAKVPSDQYKAMFFAASGIVRFLSQTQTEFVSRYARPLTDWEVDHRNAVERCNIVVFDWTDAHAMEAWQEQTTDDSFGDATLEDLEAVYEKMLKSARQNASHNLMRHYWKFLLVDDHWKYTVRGIGDDQSDETLSNIDWSWNDWANLLSFDGWIGISSAQAWKSLMERAGLDNDINANFCRIFSFPPIQPKEKDKKNFKEDETRMVNPSKVKVIERWLSNSDVLVPSDEQDVPVDPQVRMLMRLGAANRSCIEIPLPWIGTEVP